MPGGRTLPRRPLIPSLDLIRRGGPAPLKSAENGRAGPSGRRDRWPRFGPAPRGSTPHAVGRYTYGGPVGRPGDYLIVANRSSTAPGEAEMGDRREQMTIRWSRFPSRPSRERSRCEWRRPARKGTSGGGERISIAVLRTNDSVTGIRFVS